MIINFYLEKRPDKNGNRLISVYLTPKGGKRVKFSTGYAVPAEDWDGEQKKVRRKAVNADGVESETINAHLDRIRAHFGNLDNKYDNLTTEQLRKLYYEFTLSPEKVEQAIKKAETPKRKKLADTPMYDLVDRFVKDQGTLNGWSVSTKKKMKTLANHLLDIAPTMSCSKLNDAFLDEFVRHFIGLGFNNNYVLKISKTFSWFLRWAMRKNYCPKDLELDRLRPNLTVPKKPIIFLTTDELRRVAEYKIPKEEEHLERVRDVFLFSCYTGLRFSDTQQLQWANVEGDFSRLNITTLKDSDNVTIPLLKPAKEILQKHKGEPYPLPHLPNQKANEHIKTLCRRVDITQNIRVTEIRGGERTDTTYPKCQLVGTHCGRKTFICMALSEGIPATTVMQITGHSDYNTMKPYVAIAENEVGKAMAALDNKISVN